MGRGGVGWGGGHQSPARPCARPVSHALLLHWYLVHLVAARDVARGEAVRLEHGAADDVRGGLGRRAQARRVQRRRPRTGLRVADNDPE